MLYKTLTHHAQVGKYTSVYRLVGLVVKASALRAEDPGVTNGIRSTPELDVLAPFCIWGVWP